MMMTAKTTAVSVSNVSKRYRLGATETSMREALSGVVRSALRRGGGREDKNGYVWALREVSFEVPEGGALGLIGPNGAGKTTALKILANITQPSQGEVNVSGRVSALIELGAGFHPELTGRENIYLNGSILGLSRREIEASFDRIVEFSGLKRFIDTPVKRYSSGMYVRLGFSVAAHVEPDVLLVDEVLAVGDAQFRQKCARRIAELRQMGTTIVFVAHNLYLVKSVCEQVAFINEGRLQEYGDAVSVINAYESWLHDRQTQTVGQSKFSVDPKLERPAGIDLIEVEVMDEQGGEAELFDYDTPVAIRASFVSREVIERPNIILRILRSDGVTCCMIRSSDVGFEPGALAGEGAVVFRIDPLQLAGGAYAVEATITGAIDGLPLAQRHSRWFKVKGQSLGYQEASGVFVANVTRAWLEQSVDPQGEVEPLIAEDGAQ